MLNFKQSIVCISVRNNPRALVGPWSSIVDLILFTKCKFFIGSYYSSYSTFIVFWRGYRDYSWFKVSWDCCLRSCLSFYLALLFPKVCNPGTKLFTLHWLYIIVSSLVMMLVFDCLLLNSCCCCPWLNISHREHDSRCRRIHRRCCFGLCCCGGCGYLFCGCCCYGCCCNGCSSCCANLGRGCASHVDYCTRKRAPQFRLPRKHLSSEKMTLFALQGRLDATLLRSFDRRKCYNMLCRFALPFETLRNAARGFASEMCMRRTSELRDNESSEGDICRSKIEGVLVNEELLSIYASSGSADAMATAPGRFKRNVCCMCNGCRCPRNISFEYAMQFYLRCLAKAMFPFEFCLSPTLVKIMRTFGTVTAIVILVLLIGWMCRTEIGFEMIWQPVYAIARFVAYVKRLRK